MKIRNLLYGIGIMALSSCAGEKTENLDVDKALAYCDVQVHRALAELEKNGEADYSMQPRNILSGEKFWNCRKVAKEEWTGGFWPGILWYDYEATQNDTIRELAEKYTESLKLFSEIPAYDHDLGFLVFCSYGNGYRLTHNPTYRDVIIATADSLATLYNPKVGTILSWPRNIEMLGGHNTIMDNMINLEMLFWAARNGGDRRLFDVAVSHADKTMENQFRPDYTSYHVAVYDTLTGNCIKKCTHQGYADESMWARGQAWAIYGYTVVFRETGDPKYLEFAEKLVDVYLKNLPEDYVPYWDFNAPDIPNAPRDASAACVVASALLEMSGFYGNGQGEKYKEAAEKIRDGCYGLCIGVVFADTHAREPADVGRRPARNQRICKFPPDPSVGNTLGLQTLARRLLHIAPSYRICARSREQQVASAALFRKEKPRIDIRVKNHDFFGYNHRSFRRHTHYALHSA